MKVYSVMYWDYSATALVNIYPSREEAEKGIDDPKCEIEEWDLDLPESTITIANIDSEIGRKLGMEKGKKYTIALLGEAE